MAHKIVVIGGVAGGASFAARARRLSEKSELIIIERGGYVSFANCGMPYFLGGEIEKRQDLLLQTPETLKARLNLDVRIKSEVISISKESKTVRIQDTQKNITYDESYDYLVMAPGAAPVIPPLPGIDSDKIFTLRSIEDLDKISSWIEGNKAKRAAIIGAGFIGLEVAEQLHKKIPEITIVEALNQVLAPLDPEMAILLESEIKKHGVKLIKNDPVSHFSEDTELTVHTKSGQKIQADFALLSIGVRPEVTLAKSAGLEIGSRGGIKVNDYLQTSDPYIYAVGDAIEVKNALTGEYAPVPLAGPANRQGRLVADNILGTKSAYQGTISTAIARVFSLTAASTGINEKTLKRLNLEYQTLYLYPNSHAGYYPGAKELAIKIIFNSNTGSIYGAQIVAEEGADKRIDVIATAIKGGLTIDDLADLELAYAPPFSSAKDPVNLCGMAAQNTARGLCPSITAAQLDAKINNEFFILDVRNVSETLNGIIPGAINIPLNEIRNRLNEIPKDREIVTYCASALRSYYACRILMQNGFKVFNLTGAYKAWRQYELSK